MKPIRWARNLKGISIVVTAVLGVLAVQSSAWGQQADKQEASAASPTAPAAPAATSASPPPSSGEAEAVQNPPPGPQAIPAPPSPHYPPPGYGPPPGMPYRHRYGYTGYSPPYDYGYFYAPARPVTHRPFMFGIGMGLGTLAYSSSNVSKTEAAMAYSIHLGFSITARWMILLGMDGSWGQFTFDDAAADPTLPYGKVSVALTSYTAGAQFFIMRWLYARLGLGAAWLEWSDNYGDASDGRGQALSGAVGAEFLQTPSTAMAAELGAFVVRFPDAMTVQDRNDIWYHIGVNLILNLF